MTLVITVQVVVAGLAAALLFDLWTHRDQTPWEYAPSDDSADSIQFHPELIVRWDDEASHAAPTPACARRSASDRRARARSQSATVRPRSFTR